MLKLSIKRKVTVIFFVGVALTLSSFLYCYPHTSTRGHSMEPALFGGGLAILDKNIPDEELTGQIIAFKPDWSEIEILHRVEEDFGKMLVTKGDNNDFSDLPIQRQDIFGVVIAHCPFEWLYFVEAFTISMSIGVVAYIVITTHIEEKHKLLGFFDMRRGVKDVE